MADRAKRVLRDALDSRAKLHAQCEALGLECQRLWIARQEMGGESIPMEALIEIVGENPQVTMFDHVKGKRIMRVWNQHTLLALLASTVIAEQDIVIDGRYASMLMITPDQQTFRVEVIIPDETVTK